MTAIRFLYLSAVVLTTASLGCGSSRLFSRADLDRDDQPLGAPTPSDPQLTAAALFGNGPDGPAATTDSGLAATGSRSDGRLTANPVLPVSEHLARAKLAFDEQRLTTARQHLDSIIWQQPGHPEAHHRLAVISDLEGRFGDAEHHYRAALQSDRNNAAIVGDLGYSYLMQGRLDHAEQCLIQAQTLDPADQNSAFNLAVLYSRRGDIAGAHRALFGVFPPIEVQQTLAQLFPGAPPQHFAAAQHQGATPAPYPAPPPAGPAPYQPYAFSTPRQDDDTAGPLAPGAAPHQTAMVVTPEMTGSMPNVAPPGATFPRGAIVANLPYTHAGGGPSPPSGIAQASADVPPAQANAGRSSTAPARRWPPSVWPPQDGVVPAGMPPENAPTSSARPTSGVTYLMQRRSPATPQPTAGAPSVPAMNPANVPAALPGMMPAGDLHSREHAASPPDPQARYSSGPGSSRIVTWPNLNGQSIDATPLPPSSAETQADVFTSSAGLAAPLPQSSLRTSPGSAAGWNGGQYPPPQRQLPGSTPTIFDYPPQGEPVRAGAPGTATTPPLTSAGMPVPHAGFVIAPDSPAPTNPLAGYEADRQRFDQQFQQQVDQTYARSPAGFIPPPSAGMVHPGYEVPAWNPQQGVAAPTGPGGTPWYGQAADSPTRSPETAYRSAPPTSAPVVRPAASPVGAGNPTYAPPYYRPSPAVPHHNYGPAIVPGP